MRDLPLPTLPMADLSSHLSAESRAARRSLHPRSAPEASTRPGIEVVWARTAQDVLAAQRLRYEVFAVEMGARLSVPVGSPAGHDIDLFDPYCEHLLVRLDTGTNEPGQVIGTYRVLTPESAKRIGGLYSETEFDLTRLRPLRGKMVVQEDKRYSREYLEADKRSIANAIQVFFKDGSHTAKVEVEYPVGHRRRREEGIPLLVEKFRHNLATRFPAKRSEAILALCQDGKQLASTPVHAFMDLLVI